MSPPGLELDGITFGQGGWTLAADLAVRRGELLALIGASGAGKSTLLSLAAGFERPLSGRVLVDGRVVTDLPPASRPITTLFQEHNLFAHLSALDNVALGLHPGLRLTASDRRTAHEGLSRVELESMAHRRPGELSGGERQRVALARALVMKRPVLLLDEPFAALGPALRRTMLDLVSRLRRESGLTVVMVTHDPGDARRIADSIAFMDGGRILLTGSTASVLDAPVQPVTGALSRSRLRSGTVVNLQGGGKSCPFRAGDEGAGEHRVRFHELHVDLLAGGYARGIVRLDEVVDRRVGRLCPRADQGSRIMEFPHDPDFHAGLFPELPSERITCGLVIVDPAAWILPHEEPADVFGGNEDLAVAQQDAVDAVVLGMGHEVDTDRFRVMKDRLL